MARPSHDVRIRIGGEEYSKWSSYSLESNMLQDADAFEFTLNNKGGELSAAISVLDEVQVLIDGTIQLSGYVDRIQTSVGVDGSPELTVQGRDRFGQLVDVMPKPQTITGKDLLQIAEALSTPFVTNWVFDNSDNLRRLQNAKRRLRRLERFQQTLRKTRTFGIKKDTTTKKTYYEVGGQRVPIDLSKRGSAQQIAIDANESRVSTAKAFLNKIKRELFPRVKIDAGQTIMEVITRLASRAGFLVWQHADGSGIISRPNYGQEPSYSIHFHGPDSARRQRNNALSGQVARDGSQRYRSYRLKGYSVNTANKKGKGARHDRTITDSDVALSARTYYEDSDGAGTAKQAREKLLRERQRREFEALVATYVFRGHGLDGVLWQHDAIAAVEDTINSLSGKLYLVRRRFYADEEGQHTEIELRKAGVYLP